MQWDRISLFNPLEAVRVQSLQAQYLQFCAIYSEFTGKFLSNVSCIVARRISWHFISDSLQKIFCKRYDGKFPFPEAAATTEILVAGEKGGDQAKVLSLPV